MLVQNGASAKYIKNISWYIMKTFLILTLVITALCAQDTLLTLSRTSSCLKDLVSSFIRAEDCNKLSDNQKAKLAMKMSKCLMKEMGRSLPEQCDDNFASCKLEGDAWNTFSTFFAHIDNLCHFYWETLHHQRAQKLIGQLSESSSKAEAVLRSNSQETRKILSMQLEMHSNLDDSLVLQQKMAELINSSAIKVTNLTQQVQTFVQKIHQDLDENYASIRNLLSIINEGVTKLLQIQRYIQAQITTLSGILFFLTQFLVVLFVTSFRKYKPSRNALLSLIFLQAASELALLPYLTILLSITQFRFMFIGFMIFHLVSKCNNENDFEAAVENSLNSSRFERIISRAAQKKKWELAKNITLNSLSMMAKENEEGERRFIAGKGRAVQEGREHRE